MKYKVLLERGREMKHYKKIILFGEGFLLVNILWYVAAIFMNAKVLPTPIQVYAHFPEILQKGMIEHTVASLYRVFMGVGIAALIGMFIGIMMAYSPALNRLLNPLVYFTYPIPKTALLPIVMILMGLGDGSKITLIVLIIVFQFIFAVRDAILNVSREHYISLISLGASKWQMSRHLTFPAILPPLLSNIRIGIGTALSILFFTETYGTRVGLGYFIQDAWNRIDYLDMYCGIILLSVIGLMLFLIIDYIENILCKWRGKSSL